MRNDLFVSEEKLLNKNYTDAELGVLVALNGLIVGDLTECHLCYSILYSALYHRKTSESEKKNVKNAFSKLIEKGDITITKQIDSSSFICNVEKVYVNTSSNKEEASYYVCIHKDELHTIMNINDKVINFKLLRVFLCYVNSLHKGDKIEQKYRGKIGYLDMNTLANKSNVHIDSLRTYNTILVENELLYIVRHSASYINANYKSSTNTYSRFTDRHLCMDYASFYKKNVSSDKYLTMTKFLQSNSTKYIHFLKGKEYTLKELYEIKEYLMIQNLKDSTYNNSEKQIDLKRIDDAISDIELFDAEFYEHQYNRYKEYSQKIVKHNSEHLISTDCSTSSGLDFLNIQTHTANTLPINKRNKNIGLDDILEKIFN